MAYINNLGQVRIGVRGWVAQTTTSNVIDVDATAFITAAGITDTTQISALNTLVNDLKTYGLWTKMKALYPFVGGSAASHKFNLKDPRDLDAAYRLVFNGGWIHSSNGAKPNGTTGYADTKLAPNVMAQNSIHASFYSRTDITGPYWDLGAYNAGGGVVIGPRYQSGASFVYMNVKSNDNTTDNNPTIGLYMGNRTSSTTNTLFRNGVIIVNGAKTSFAPISLNIYLGADNEVTIVGYSPREQAFASIGDGLTDTEASNFYISVQKFQTTLGRHVGTPYVSDPDAIAFLTAAGITDGTQAAAINTLVIRMKADGVWTKMKAIYPFVGGSAASHKFNLKDPRDLDAAFRLVFNGGWTHTGTGAKPNGTTGYANTYLNPSSDLLANSGFGWYSITNNNTTSSEMGAMYYDMPSANNVRSFQVARNSGTIYVSVNSQDFQTFTDNDTRGFYQSYRTDSSTVKTLKNRTLYTTTLTYYPMVSMYCYIGARNERYIPQVFSDKCLSFAYFQSNFTDNDATALYSAVQAFQTTLGRQTDVPLVSDTDAQAFLNAANITSFQQASAVNKLVVDLKAAGVWTKMKAIYPFVGGSADSHKFNLKDPRDLDAAFRLVFNGGWVHSITGVSPNGSNAYADTKLIPSTNGITTSNAHISFYSRNTNVNGLYPVDMGVDQPGTGLNLSQKMSSIDSISYHGRAFAQRIDGVDSNNISGLHMLSRISTTSLKYIRNNSLIQTITTIETGSVPTLPIFIGSLNNNGTPGLYSTRESGFASIGDGLTDTESTAFYNAVQTYQTSLGRHVATPVYNNGLVLNLDAGNANSYPGTGTTWFDLASGKNATLLNGPVYNSNNGGYLSLDGVNDRIDTTYTPGTFTNQTIIAWINKTNTQYCFILQRNSSPPFGFEIYPTTIYVAYGAFEAYVGYNTNGWHQVAYVFDGTQTGNSNRVKVYLNGVLQNLSFGSNPPSSITINDVMQVGWRPWASLYSSVGISTLQMYNTSLSATEILNNFNSTRGRFGL